MDLLTLTNDENIIRNIDEISEAKVEHDVVADLTGPRKMDAPAEETGIQPVSVTSTQIMKALTKGKV